MSERLQQALQLLLRGQDSDSVNHFFTSALCEGDQSCRVDLERGTVNIFDGESGDEVDFLRFAISIQEVATKGLRIDLDMPGGQREVDLKIVDVASGKQVFWGSGSFDAHEGDWLCMDIFDHSMLDGIESLDWKIPEDQLSPDPDENAATLEDLVYAKRQELAKKVMAFCVSVVEDGTTYDDVEAIVTAFDDDDYDVSYL